MKTFLLDLIPRIQKYSKNLDDISILTGKHWVLLGGDSTKTVYIFRTLNNQLIISKNGRIEKAKWEHIGKDSIIIDVREESFLFKHGFIDDSILALKLDGTNEYALFINETRFIEFLDSIEKAISFLKENYLVNNPNSIKSAYQRLVDIEIENIPSNEQPEASKHIPVPKIISWAKNENLKYTFISTFSETHFQIYNQEGKWGFIDKELNVVIDFLYDDVFPFSEGLAAVQLNGKKGFINRKGEIVIGFQFDKASYFKNGKSSVSIDGEEFSINPKGIKL